MATHGDVFVAYGGQEALMKIAVESFDIIISLANMRIMDGIDFYKAAVKARAMIKDRFLFYTGVDNREHILFFKKTIFSCYANLYPQENLIMLYVKYWKKHI
jgi:response regulator RpfG family c-di-GMP phosphodiesterase